MTLTGNMRINGDRLWDALMEMAKIGPGVRGGNNRQTLTDEDAEAALADITARTAEAHGGLPGSVLVSDGFFPFRDGVDVAVAQGVTAIAQPGGSIRDFEIIEAVNQAVPQVAMVFTAQRSFKH